MKKSIIFEGYVKAQVTEKSRVIYASKVMQKRGDI